MCNWNLPKTTYRHFLAATICLLTFSTTPSLLAQAVDKIQADPTTSPSAESTWKDGETLFSQATKFEEEGRLDQAASAYENAINIFRGLQLMDDSFKKDLVSLRITTCKLRSSSLRRIAQHSKTSNSNSAVTQQEGLGKMPQRPKVETSVTTKAPPRTGSIIEQISQMENEIAALRTENLALIENMNTLKSSAAELARIKDLEKIVEQRRLEVEALKSNMGFVETRWTKEVEAKIAAQNEVKSVKADAEQQMSKLLQEKTTEMEARIKATTELAKTEREKNEKRIHEQSQNELAKIKATLDSANTRLSLNEQKNKDNITLIHAEHAKAIEGKEKTLNELKKTHTEQFNISKKESEQALLVAIKQTDDLKLAQTREKQQFEQQLKTQLEEKGKLFLVEKTNLERTFTEQRTLLENQIKSLQDQRREFESNLKEKNQEEIDLLKNEKLAIAESSVKQKNDFETQMTEQQKQIALLQKQTESAEEQKIALVKQNEKVLTEKLTVAQKEKEEALSVMKKSLESQISNQKETLSQLEKQLSSITEKTQEQLKEIETITTEKHRLESQITAINNDLERTKELANNTEKESKNKISLMQKEMENAISATNKSKSQQSELEDLIRKRDDEIRKIRQNQVSLKEYQRKQEALEALMKENLELKKQLAK